MNRQVLSWCLFDFANSSYSAVIAAVIFPVYYAGVIVGNEQGQGDLWWGRAISLSMAFVALSSPFLGGIADYTSRRKPLLILYTLLCVCAVAAFSLLRSGMVIEGFLLIVMANVGMEGGLVFYNSFLPEISEPARRGRISAWGFATGYAGSIASLLLALYLIKTGNVTLVWPLVALFFVVFSLPAFIVLPGGGDRSQLMRAAAVTGMKETLRRFRELASQRQTRRFLAAYLIYEDGVNTVIVFSGLFAATTLNFAPDELITMYLIVQVTALAGALVMARPTDYWGPKKVISASLLLWTAVCVAAYFVQDKALFLIVASVAGTGLGTLQAATRALYTQFIPEGQESEYFGVYSMVGKSSAVVGPLLFGFMSSAFGSQRPAILAVAFFFCAGLLIISTVQGGGPTAGASRPATPSRP
jgi:UMF1 family MFS transporter